MKHPKAPATPAPFLSQSSFWTPEWAPIYTSAWQMHAPFAFWIMEAHRPRCLVELGTHWGFSYMAFCQSALRNRLDVMCHAVDNWKGDIHASFYGEEVFAAVSEHNQKCYGGFSTLIRSTFDQALELFPDGSVDLLHIDGLHTHEAVKHDFENWLPKMSDCGVVLFHDTRELDHGFGVIHLWRELASRYPSFEFHHGHGLGILGVGTQLPEAMRNLLSLDNKPASADSVRAAYERLGMGVAQDAEVAAGILRREQALEESSAALRQQAERFAEQIAGLEQSFAGEERRLQEKLSQLDERVISQERAISILQGANTELHRALDAVETWQRSWFRRAFGRWHRIQADRRPGFFRRLERSVRMRRKKLLSAFHRKDGELNGAPTGSADDRVPISKVADAAADAESTKRAFRAHK